MCLLLLINIFKMKKKSVFKTFPEDSEELSPGLFYHKVCYKYLYPVYWEFYIIIINIYNHTFQTCKIN